MRAIIFKLLCRPLGAVFTILVASGSMSSAVFAQVPVRVATFNIIEFDGDQPQFDAVRDILLRVGADVVCVQEITDFIAFEDLADAAGYPYRELASTTGAIDEFNHAGVMSIYPIVSSYTATSVSLSGDTNAHDMTRNFIVAVIDVGGAAQDLVLSGNHWKSGGDDADEFRRSVESVRAMQSIAFADGTIEPIVVLGDMNDDILDVHDSPNDFTQLPSGLPISFELGNDIELPIENSVFQPILEGTGPAYLTAVDARQVDGTDGTVASGRRIDYIWHSDAVTVLGAEVYDSADEDLPGGLPKDGNDLPAEISSLASDHLLVFADLELVEAVDVTGACCLGGACDDTLTQEDCLAGGGFFYGPEAECDEPLDPPCVAVPIEVLINEVLVSHDGDDDMEFIELFGSAGGGLHDLSVVIVEGETLSKGIIDLIVSLDGYLLNSTGYFTVGDAAVSPDLVVATTNSFENGTQTILLVQDCTASPGFDTDVDNDGVAELPIGTIVDAVGIADGGFGSTDVLYFGASPVGPVDGSLPAGGARFPNGADSDQSLDWQLLSFFLDGSDGLLPISPGVSNGPESCEGDVNADGTVDPLDVGAIQARFGQPVPPNDLYDVNGDGTIDPLDAGYVAARFGLCE